MSLWEDVEAFFEERVWERGEGYWLQGRVSLLRGADAFGPEDEPQEVFARVRGSGGRRYETRFAIRPVGDGYEFDGRCECPAPWPCKHMAAVGCAIREAVDEAQDEAWGHDCELEHWAARVRAAAGREAIPEEANAVRGRRKRLVFVIDVCERGAVLEAVAVNLRKDGSFGKGRALASLPGAYGERPPKWIDNEDLSRWIRADAIQRAYDLGFGAPIVLPRIKPATDLFVELVESGHAYLRYLDSPALRLGPRREGRWSWDLDERGVQSLSLRPLSAEARWVVLTLSPPYYCEADTGVCGPIEIDLAPAVVAALLNAPPVEPAQTSEPPEAFMNTLVELGLPLPTRLALEVRDGLAPIPVLRLQSLATSGSTTEAAQLRFDYGGIVVGSDEPGLHSHVDGSTVVQIRPDRPTERAARETLARLGFEEGSIGWTLPSPQLWIEFCGGPVQELEADGWRIEIGADFPWSAERPDGWFLEAEEVAGGEWFTLVLGVEIDGVRLNVLPAIVRAIQEGGLRGECGREPDTPIVLELPDGRRVQVPRSRIAAILDTLVELYRDKPLIADRLKLRKADAVRLDDLDAQWHGGERVRALAERLRDRGVGQTEPPAGLQATLRAYQRQGLDWLQLLRSSGLGGILADDMGLGKTIQALAHLLVEKEQGRLDRPCLVVAPRSVLRNWQREAERFAPGLSTEVFHGPNRAGVLERPPDLVITTYALLQRDEALTSRPWHIVILDESQSIKNWKTKGARAARQLEARHRLCMTGTPMENHLGELRSLIDFVMPGFLGNEREFNARYRRKIERGDAERFEALRRRLAPFILRRTKSQVLPELPAKTEVLLPAELSGAQLDLYESVRLTMEKRVRKALSERGLAKSQIIVLDALLKLRQICCDPRLVHVKGVPPSADSAKLDLLRAMMGELLAEGRRVLIFSQFTSMLELIRADLDERGIGHLSITGKSRKRQEVVDRFQAGEVPVLLVSLKAGGTGLNLTRADTVIHYDPWWNPAVEAQATDRTHRIGQSQPVTVYRLVCEGTVEERMLRLQENKRVLTEGLQQSAERISARRHRLSNEEIETLLAPLGE